MPLPGGATDKVGNRYEDRWTVYCTIDVMDEKADSIRPEEPGEDGFEFFLSRKGNLEYHQVKRQKSGLGHWTLKALEDGQVQVLSDFWRILSNPDVSCVFVSTQDADQLGELANRARDAASWIEFDQKFLNKTLSGHFHTLRQKWHNCSEIDAYKALKRIHVQTVGEDFLINTVENRLAVLVEGDPKTIRLELAELARENIHHELTTHDIWHHLIEERGYRRREWGKDPHVLAAVDKLNDRYLDRLYKEAIAGKVIPRDEVGIILDKLTSPDSKRGVLVAGEAGVGKSGVILQAVEALRKKRVPIIAFRVDRLDPTNSPAHVGEQLEKLPGSPAHVLANIARGRDCVLIIDQLDAVSTASGRNPQFFECIDQIIDQVKAYPQMRILLACRKFDLDYDYRLKRLTGENGIAETVTISRLSHTQVREVVAKLGLDSSLLNNKQLELLSIPLHLKLLAEVPEVSKANALNFRTAKDLYDKFWDYKKDVIHARIGDSEHWTDVIYTLCDCMSKHQRLSGPKARVDRYGKTAEWMASEHVLIPYGQQYSFFHESFFDYAFARRFAGEDEELLNFLGSREQQHLFRRAQVRQILLYERDAEWDRYLDDLQALLTSSNIRFHIKQVVFALLAALDDPTEEEWEIIAPLIGDKSDPITQQVWGTLRSSIHWFQLLDSLGIIENWLRDENEERIDQTVTLLRIMQRQIPDRVAELAEPFIGVSEAWRNRLNYLVQGAELGIGERFFRLFLRLIREGILDWAKGIGDYERDFWMLIYSLPDQHPDWACEAISYYLNRYLDFSLAAGQPNLFDENSGILPISNSDEEVLSKSACNAPRAYIEYILPFMLRVMELTATQEGNPPWQDAVWGWRMYGDDYGIDNALLNNMEKALSNLAANYPEDFATIAEQYFIKSNFETIQYLLVRAYTTNGKKFADEAIGYLCEEPVRLKTGGLVSRNAIIHDEPYFYTELLLKATTTHCSKEKLLELETVILDYYPEEQKYTIDLKSRGYPQFLLLEAIDSSRRTEVANRRLQEWRRKFTPLRSEEIEPPKLIGASILESPISNKAAEKMTDKQWLSAVASYDSHQLISWVKRPGKFAGGARELASILENQVKKDPERFVILMHRFPDNLNSSYFDAVLRGIAEVGLDVETAFHVCQYCHQLPQQPCGRSISWLFHKLAELPWTQEALDIVIWYGLNDHNPQPESQLSNKSSDIHFKGINSTRGSAVSAIAKLIFADKNRAAYFIKPLEQIVKDSSTAVRSCAAEALTAFLNYDRNLAVSLFQQLCETEEVLLGTQTVEYFLYYAISTHFQELASIIERMIMSEEPEVVKVGARQACLASLNIKDAHWLIELCLSGTEAHRLAAAEIFITNLRNAHCREFCETALVKFFHDSSEKVRSEAAKCFLKFEGEQLGEYISLVDKFIDSPAFDNGDDNLIRALEKTRAKLPDALTYRVCDRFFKDLQSNDANIHNPKRFRADKVSKLLVRLYSQSKNQQLKSDCLNLIDIMAEMEVYELTQVLTEYER